MKFTATTFATKSQEARSQCFCAYRYDERFRILSGHAIRPDFYLPELDVYVEYWGTEPENLVHAVLRQPFIRLYFPPKRHAVSMTFDRDSRRFLVLFCTQDDTVNAPPTPERG